MTDETPDFTFALSDEPTRDQIQPIYTRILSAGTAPKVSLGTVTRAEAEAWLRAQHLKYRSGVDQRSHLIKNMDLPARVELVGLSDGSP